MIMTTMMIMSSVDYHYNDDYNADYQLMNQSINQSMKRVGWSAVCWAAARNKKEVIRYLIDECKFDIHFRNQSPHSDPTSDYYDFERYRGAVCYFPLHHYHQRMNEWMNEWRDWCINEWIIIMMIWLGGGGDDEKECVAFGLIVLVYYKINSSIRHSGTMIKGHFYLTFVVYILFSFLLELRILHF